MRRVLALWLPRLPTDRLQRQWARAGKRWPAQGLAIADRTAQRPVLMGLDAAAEAAGLAAGLTVAEARARHPELTVAAADSEADARALAGLAGWAERFTPWVAIDPPAGLVLDVTGCAHLFGGEAGLVTAVRERLAAIGYTARAGLASTVGAAWAWARFAEGGAAAEAAILPAAATESRERAALAEALAPLPVAALRLPEATVAALGRLGLPTVGDLAAVPRGPLATRFGADVPRRLDQALGAHPEPVSPRQAPPARHTRLAFAEPIAATADIDAAIEQLTDGLCALLARGREGARRIVLTAHPVAGTAQEIAVGTSRPTRRRAHILRLLHEKRAALAPGFGFEVLSLAAPRVEALGAEQLPLDGELGDGATPTGDDAALGELVDKLAARLGRSAVVHLVERASYVPERAQTTRPAHRNGAPKAAAAADTPPPAGRRPVRPPRLLPEPEPVAATAPVPDSPPVQLRWRGDTYRIARADGPERILPEWWDPAQAGAPVRDYYRVETTDGRRLWLFRAGLYGPDSPAPQWYVHGVFG